MLLFTFQYLISTSIICRNISKSIYIHVHFDDACLTLTVCQQWHATGVLYRSACTENCKHEFQTLHVSSYYLHIADTISFNFQYRVDNLMKTFINTFIYLMIDCMNFLYAIIRVLLEILKMFSIIKKYDYVILRRTERRIRYNLNLYKYCINSRARVLSYLYFLLYEIFYVSRIRNDKEIIHIHIHIFATHAKII